MVDGAEREDTELALAERRCFWACSSLAMYWMSSTKICVS